MGTEIIKIVLVAVLGIFSVPIIENIDPTPTPTESPYPSPTETAEPSDTPTPTVTPTSNSSEGDSTIDYSGTGNFEERKGNSYVKIENNGNSSSSVHVESSGSSSSEVIIKNEVNVSN